MKAILLLAILCASSAYGANLTLGDLPGVWVPPDAAANGPRSASYKLVITEDMRGRYIEISGKGDKPMNCEYKSGGSQDTVFVFYCYDGKQHAITLALAGWAQDDTYLIYGYEYWVGWPSPGVIYGGVPVSFDRADKPVPKGFR